MEKQVKKVNFPLIFTIGSYLLMIGIRHVYVWLFWELEGLTWFPLISRLDMYFHHFIEVFIILILFKLFNYSPSSLIGKREVRKKPMLECLVFMAIVVVFAFVSYFILYPFVTGTPYAFEFANRLRWQIQRDPAVNSWIRAFIVYVIIAPIAEEFVYRGFFLNAMSDWLGKGISLVLSSIIFVSIHQGRDIVNLFILFLVGMLWGLIYLRTKQLIYPIIGHALFNLLIVFIQPLVMRTFDIYQLFDIRYIMFGVEVETLAVESFREFQIIFFVCLFIIVGYIIWNAVKIYDEELPYHYNLDTSHQETENPSKRNYWKTVPILNKGRR